MPEKTIDRISTAALELFTEKGYFATSMKDIAKKVGISAPAIYAHYDSKKNIFFHVVDKCLDQYICNLRNDLDQLAGIYDEESLIIFFKLRIQSFKENERLNKFLVIISIGPEQTLNENVANKLRDNSHAICTHYQNMYMNLADRKIIKPVGVEIFARSLNRLIDGIFFDVIADEEPFDEITLDILWHQYWEGIKKI